MKYVRNLTKHTNISEKIPAFQLLYGSTSSSLVNQIFDMTHKIVSKRPIQPNQWQIDVDLSPQNQLETTAIANMGRTQATDLERQLVEDYLYFNLNLGNYSVIDLLAQRGTSFQLKVYIM